MKHFNESVVITFHKVCEETLFEQIGDGTSASLPSVSLKGTNRSC